MNEDFYLDLQKRMYSIALFGELFGLLKSKGRSLEKYGFERLDQQILLFFMVLRFIMERTLESETCLMEDIAQAIREISREVFHLALCEDECLSLSILCVSDILFNKGEPFFFNPIEGDERWKVRINYLDSEIVYEGNTPHASYKMSEDGFHLMLSTLEMEENMQLQFRDLVFELQMKSGNYPKALDEIREIFQLLRIQEKELDNLCVQTRSNAAAIDNELYTRINQQTFELMEESRAKMRRHQKNVEFLLQDLHRSIAEGSFTQKDEQNFDALKKINAYLSSSILAHTAIFDALNRFSALLDDQLDYQLRQSFYARRPFKQAVFKPLMSNPALLENFDLLLHAMLLKPIPKRMAVEKAFRYAPLRKNSEDGSWQEVDERFDEEEYERQKQEAAARVERSNAIIISIFSKLLLAPGHEMKLDELLSADCFESSTQAREILVALSTLTIFDLEGFSAARNELIFEEQTAFSLPFAILDALDQLEALAYFAQLSVKKAEGSAHFVINEDGLQMDISADNLLLRLERKSL